VYYRVFEMLYAFRRVNENLRLERNDEVSRLRTEWARREVYVDKFSRFADWTS
jgi:hypothetical protein